MSSFYISYVSKDKEFVHELTTALQDKGIETFDGRLGLGVSLSASLKEGLQEASLAILILSKAFFDKSWPRFEFEEVDKIDAEFENGTRLLPIWLDIDPSDVSYFAPELAQRAGFSTTHHDLNSIVEELGKLLKEATEGNAQMPTAETVQFTKGFSPDTLSQKSFSSPQVALRQNLNIHFNETEIMVLCFDLGIDYDDLVGSNQQEKVLSLIGQMQREGRLESLIDLVRLERPYVDW